MFDECSLEVAFYLSATRRDVHACAPPCSPHPTASGVDKHSNERTKVVNANTVIVSIFERMQETKVNVVIETRGWAASKP